MCKLNKLKIKLYANLRHLKEIGITFFFLAAFGHPLCLPDWNQKKEFGTVYANFVQYSLKGRFYQIEVNLRLN